MYNPKDHSKCTGSSLIDAYELEEVQNEERETESVKRNYRGTDNRSGIVGPYSGHIVSVLKNTPCKLKGAIFVT